MSLTYLACMYSTVGCHPTYCQKFIEAAEGAEKYLEQLIELAAQNKDKIVCIGEMGLGSCYNRISMTCVMLL